MNVKKIVIFLVIVVVLFVIYKKFISTGDEDRNPPDEDGGNGGSSVEDKITTQSQKDTICQNNYDYKFNDCKKMFLGINFKGSCQKTATEYAESKTNCEGYFNE